MTLVPQFRSLEAFLAMGGHAPFVWGAWGLTALVIVALTVHALRAQGRWRARVEALEAARAARETSVAEAGS